MSCEIFIDNNNDEYTIGVTGGSCGEWEITAEVDGATIPLETDPIFTAHAAFDITGEDITNWNTAYGWGNHALNLYDTTGAAVTQRTQHEALFNHTNIHAAGSDAETASTIGTLFGGVSAATPVSGDKFPFVQAVGNTLKTITKSNLIAQIAADATFITTGDNISLLTNDAGFITTGDLTNDYEASGGIASHLLAFNHGLIAVYETSGEMSGHLTDFDHAAFARVVTAPLSATGSGDAGTMALDDNYAYFCVSTNTWRRTPIANW